MIYSLLGGYCEDDDHVWAWLVDGPDDESEPADDTPCKCGQVLWKDRPIYTDDQPGQ